MSGKFPDSFALFDADHRLVDWNEGFVQEYRRIGLALTRGLSYAEMLRAARANLTPEELSAVHSDFEDIERELQQRLAGFGEERTSEYRTPTGRIVRIDEQRSLSGGVLRSARHSRAISACFWNRSFPSARYAGAWALARAGETGFMPG